MFGVTPCLFRLWRRIVAVGLVLLLLPACEKPGATAAEADVALAPHMVAATEAAAGEYLTIVGGCNDCHTAGWNETFGKVSGADRLMGLPVGFRGPWGTSYPANLRLSATSQTATQWIAMIRSRTGNPPMPWMNLHQMTDRDLAAIHAYINSLGPKGEPVPAFVPPGQEPVTPYILFEPVMPKGAN